MTGERDAAPLRVVLVEDEDLYRDLLRGCLEQEPGLKVVGSFGAGPSAPAAAPAVRPDVALLDVQMPGLNGFETAQALRALVPALRIVLTSTVDDRAYAAAAARLGAAFLPRGRLSPHALLDLLHSADGA